MSTEFIVALIASLSSLVVAIVTALFALWTDAQRRRHENAQAAQSRQHGDALASAQREHERQLKDVQARIDELSAERNARLDYEYEARKNLYGTVAPLLFQMSEFGDSARRRISGLARTARNGDLGPEKDSWLASEGYYYTSTLYRLLAPLAVGELIRRQLTVVDVSLDRGLAMQYRLIRQLTTSFSDDYRFAEYEPEVPYHPDESDSGHGDELGNPDRLRRQGVYTGWLEQARDSLIRKDSPDGPSRVINYGEFEALYAQSKAIGGSANAIHRLRFLLDCFHPGRHRVLWRMLVTQDFLYGALIGIREAQLAGQEPPERPIRKLSDRELAELDWTRAPEGEASAMSLAVTEAVTVARRYLFDTLPELVPEEFSGTLPLSREA